MERTVDVKVREINYSYVVTIPKNTIKAMKIKEGDIIQIKIIK